MSRTILKNLHAYQGKMPQLDQFPKSQQVTFKYYEGVLFFLEENYVEVCIVSLVKGGNIDIVQAEKRLAEALSICHKDARRNKE